MNIYIILPNKGRFTDSVTHYQAPEAALSCVRAWVVTHIKRFALEATGVAPGRVEAASKTGGTMHDQVG